jgi:hypothetical protein
MSIRSVKSESLAKPKMEGAGVHLHRQTYPNYKMTMDPLYALLLAIGEAILGL